MDEQLLRLEVSVWGNPSLPRLPGESSTTWGIFSDYILTQSARRQKYPQTATLETAPTTSLLRRCAEVNSLVETDRCLRGAYWLDYRSDRGNELLRNAIFMSICNENPKSELWNSYLNNSLQFMLLHCSEVSEIYPEFIFIIVLCSSLRESVICLLHSSQCSENCITQTKLIWNLQNYVPHDIQVPRRNRLQPSNSLLQSERNARINTATRDESIPRLGWLLLM